MLAKHRGKTIKLTEEFISALIGFMIAHCEMMKAEEPDQAEQWAWGRAYITDLAAAQGLEFLFGSAEEKAPDGMLGFAVQCTWVKWPSKADLENGPIRFCDPLGRWITYRLIRAHEARDWDGTPSNWIPGTADGDRECIELATTSNGRTTYENRWLS